MNATGPADPTGPNPALMSALTTEHHTPGVTADAGPVAYLLSAGAAADVVGLRSWELPAATLAEEDRT